MRDPSGLGVARTALGTPAGARRRRLSAACALCGVALLGLLMLSPGAGAAGAAANHAGAPATTLNVMVFNIEVGGTLVSFDKVIEAIAASGADVVGIEEAQGHIGSIAHGLGWPYFNNRYQIVSKYPIIDPPQSHGLYAFVEPVPGKVVAVINVHLPSDPYGPYWARDGKTPAQVIALEKRVRVPAIAPRLAAVPALLAQQIPVFLTGDFNSPSHLDWTTAAVGTRTYDSGKPWPPYALEWPVSKAVVDAGFRDSFRDVYPDPVANPGLTWWAKKPKVAVSGENFGPNDVKDRIDFVYAAGPSVTTASRIVGEQGGPEVSVAVSPWPSDHRGVVSTFDVTPATPPVFVAVDRRLVNYGDDLTVRFHAPGGAGETIALVPAGADPATQALVQQPTGATGTTDGALTFDTDPLAVMPVSVSVVGPPGHFQAVLLDGSGTVLAKTTFWMKSKGEGPRVSTAKRVYRVGQPIRVRWRDAPGNRWDWVGIYQRGANANIAYYLLWGYTNASIAGSRTLDRTAPYFGYGPQPWPLKPGLYSVYLLRDDGYYRLAAGTFRIVK